MGVTSTPMCLKPVGDQGTGKGSAISGTHVNHPRGIAKDLVKLTLDPEKILKDEMTLFMQWTVFMVGGWNKCIKISSTYKVILRCLKYFVTLLGPEWVLYRTLIQLTITKAEFIHGVEPFNLFKCLFCIKRQHDGRILTALSELNNVASSYYHLTIWGRTLSQHKAIILRSTCRSELSRACMRCRYLGFFLS